MKQPDFFQNLKDAVYCDHTSLPKRKDCPNCWMWGLSCADPAVQHLSVWLLLYGDSSSGMQDVEQGSQVVLLKEKLQQWSGGATLLERRYWKSQNAENLHSSPFVLDYVQNADIPDLKYSGWGYLPPDKYLSKTWATHTLQWNWSASQAVQCSRGIFELFSYCEVSVSPVDAMEISDLDVTWHTLIFFL